MKNIKLYKYTCVALLALCMLSCQEDESIPRRGKPAITIANKVLTVTAGETATFDLDVEYPVSNPINIRIDVLDNAGDPIIVALPTDGDATTGEGFYDLVELEDIIVPYNTWFESGYFGYGYQGGTGYVANFPAESTTLQINIETIQDLIPNNTKVVRLRLTSTSLLEATINEVVTINIENYVSDELITRLNWAGDYLESGEDPCDIDFGLDLDLELIYGGNYIQTSFSDCPEQLTILGSDPDGDYIVDASFWTNNGNTSTDNNNVPVSIDFIKPGVFFKTVNLSSLFPLNDGGLFDGNSNAITSFTVNKNGSIYTVTDSNDNEIAQGKHKAYRRSLEEKQKLK